MRRLKKLSKAARCVCLVAAILLTAATLCAAQENVSAKELLKRAMHEYDIGHYQEAAELFMQVVNTGDAAYVPTAEKYLDTCLAMAKIMGRAEPQITQIDRKIDDRITQIEKEMMQIKEETEIETGPFYITAINHEKAFIRGLQSKLEPTIKMTGEYRMSFGATSEDLIWKDADGDKQGVPYEKNWRYLWGEKRHNTYDPKIYDSLKLDFESQYDSPFNGYMQVVIDPWTFVGKKDVTITGSAGNILETELKYWSNTRRTLDEVYRTDNGDIVTVRPIKIVDGKTTSATATGLSDWGSQTWGIPESEIDMMYRPIRKFWMDYNKEELLVRTFLMADQHQALTSDDPLTLSNNHVYWEESPWLDQYESSLIFERHSQKPIKQGRWIRSLSFVAKNSDQERLTFLRGISAGWDLGDTETYATIATPMTLWDTYDEVNSIPAAVRFKKELQEDFKFGSTLTSKMGLRKGHLEASNQVFAVDSDWEFKPDLHFINELAHSWTDIKEATEFSSTYNGFAVRLELSKKSFREEDTLLTRVEDEIFTGGFSFTHMQDDFYPALSNYRHTRGDKITGKHIKFSKLSEKDEEIKIGDSVDRGRNVLDLRGKLNLLDGDFDTFFNLRNAHMDTGKYIETIWRLEPAYKVNSNLTVKGLLWYKDLPKTTENFDPIIYAKTSHSLTDYFSEEDIFLENADVEGGKDPSVGIFSGGARYDFESFDRPMALEGIYERTNDPLDFPRGLLNNTFERVDHIDGQRWDKVVPFVYDQSFFDLPPYEYYNVFKGNYIVKATPELTFTLTAVKNENKFASGLDDNINHIGLEADYVPSDRWSCGVKYIYSKLIDVYKLNKTRYKVYEGHNNFFAVFSYNLAEDRHLTLQFGEFIGYKPVTDTHVDPEWSLSALDTQYIFRLFYAGKF